MKLVLRLMAIVVAVVIGLLLAESWLFVHAEEDDLRADMSRTAEQLGRLLRHALSGSIAASDDGAIDAFLEHSQVGETALRARLVWLDAPDGSPRAPVAHRGDLAELREGKPASATTADGGALLSYVPLDPSATGDHVAAFELRETFSSMERLRRSTLRRVLIFGTMLLVGGSALAIVLGVRLVGTPLKQLVAKTRRVASGDLTTPVSLQGHDELDELARALDEMGLALDRAQASVREQTEQRIAALEQLRHADRLKTVGQLASGLAHELGTPLNVVAGRATLIGGGTLSGADVKECARIVHEQAQRMTALIRRLLDFARRGQPNRQRENLADIARSVRDLTRPLGHGGEVVVADSNQQPIALVDASQIQQVLINLVVNALQATPDNRPVTIGFEFVRAMAPVSAEQPRPVEQSWLRVRVADEGCGIAPDVLPRIFDPFFTTKDVGKGTGLGLSIVHGIVRDHDGFVEVASRVDAGTRFDVYLPAA